LGIKICHREINIAVDAIIIATLGELHVKRVEKGGAIFPKGGLIMPYLNSIRILSIHSLSTSTKNQKAKGHNGYN
jgi:hypothetical protein